MKKKIETTTSIKKNVFLSTIYQVLVLFIPLITAPYVSRVLGAEKIGIYSYTNSIQLYFTMVAALGTASYGTREIARARKSRTRRTKLFWEIELLTVFTSLACLSVWGLLIAFSRDYRIYYLILTLNIFDTMLDISWFYAGIEQFKYTIVRNSLIKILGTIAIFLFIKTPNDLAKYILIMSLTSLFGTISMWLYLPKFIKKMSFKNLRIFSHFKETFMYFIPKIATSIYTVLDKTLIGLITNNASENGYYEQATKIINIMKALAFTSLNSVLGSRISYLFAEKKYDEIHTKIEQSISYILFFGFGIMFGLIGVSELFIPSFFGDGYSKVITILRLMSPLVLIIGISNSLGSLYYNPAGLRTTSTKFIITGSVVNLILNLILIPKFWSYGACVATIIAEGTISTLYLLNCKGYLTFKKIAKLGWKKLIAGVVMLLVIFMTSNLITVMRRTLVIVCEFIFGSLTYIGILAILKDDSIQFVFNEMKKIFSKKGKEKLENG